MKNRFRLEYEDTTGPQTERLATLDDAIARGREVTGEPPCLRYTVRDQATRLVLHQGGNPGPMVAACIGIGIALSFLNITFEPEELPPRGNQFHAAVAAALMGGLGL